MTRKQLEGRALRCLLALLSIATPVVASGGMPPIRVPEMPVPCSAPPDGAALAFFEFVESANSELRLEKMGPQILAERLLNQASFSEVANLIRATKEQYDIGPKETPLSQRLVAPLEVSKVTRSRDVPVTSPDKRGTWRGASTAQANPQATTAGQVWPQDVTVRVEAYTARGRVEQRASLTCEAGVWKIESFAYGPPAGYKK